MAHSPTPTRTTAPATTAPLDPQDRARLAAAVDRAARLDPDTGTAAVLGALLPPAELRELAGLCVYDHSALLLFPPDHDALLVALADLGLSAGALVPSVVVKQRLAERHGPALAGADVRITHASVPGRGGAAGSVVEIFSCPAAQAGPDVRAAERRAETEQHTALRVVSTAPDALDRAVSLLVDRAGFCPDGGGYNPHEQRAAGGTTVRYLARVGTAPDRLVRLELKRHGRHGGDAPVPAVWSEDVARVYRANATHANATHEGEL
ncbi:hypothetical protein [Streptacidiphilus cavernicola]|uniref:Uncharacterized protein n=1 Tax=Streptacidiphilus cavernicola TaxID=3342716 RepID=A0ABV6VSH4_9ACTN